MWLAAVRDAAIVILALESIVIGALMVLMLLQLRRLVKVLREEMAPLLDSANNTVRRVENTTQFVSASVVEPLVNLRSYTEGSLQAARNLLRIRRKLKASDGPERANGGGV